MAAEKRNRALIVRMLAGIDSPGADLELIAQFAVVSPGIPEADRAKANAVAQQGQIVRVALQAAAAARVTREDLIAAAKRQEGRLILDFARGHIEFTPRADFAAEYRPAIVRLLIDAVREAAKN